MLSSGYFQPQLPSVLRHRQLFGFGHVLHVSAAECAKPEKVQSGADFGKNKRKIWNKPAGPKFGWFGEFYPKKSVFS
jgi:hypothetical protein